MQLQPTIHGASARSLLHACFWIAARNPHLLPHRDGRGAVVDHVVVPLHQSACRASHVQEQWSAEASFAQGPDV